MTSPPAKVQVDMADVTPLAFFAFATCVFTQGAITAGWTSTRTEIFFPQWLIYGGLVQIYAAIIETVRGASHSAVINGMFGVYWVIEAANVWPGHMDFYKANYKAEQLPQVIGIWKFAWAMCVIPLAIASTRVSWAHMTCMLLVLLLSWAAAGATVAPENSRASAFKAVGYIGMLVAVTAYYLGCYGYLREVGIVLPVGWFQTPALDSEPAGPGKNANGVVIASADPSTQPSH